MSSNVLTLRKSLRLKRRKVDCFTQKQSSRKVLQRLNQSAIFKQHQRIGIYLDAFGEIQTHHIIMWLFKVGKKVYLPKICNMNQHLHWVHISKQQYLSKRFNKHRFGMYEPMQSRAHSVQHLDLLLLPLLICDERGTRIGMGGGFYDRTLSRAPIRPYRVGLAHEFQCINTPLKREKWDQSLDTLVTPEKIRKFRR